jgi:competence CoiA-like predicted nuclease
MPGKRSSRKKVQRFFCPYCQERLWRLGGSKHHLLLPSTKNTQQNLHRNSQRLGKASEKTTDIDPNQWIEEFFCNEHSKVWMLVSRATHDHLTAALATQTDWQRAAVTSPIHSSHGSASKFTIRASRRTEPRPRPPEN